MTATSKSTASPMCEVACFEHEKVARIQAKLAQQGSFIPKLAQLYKLLGNEMRLKILLALAHGELCVCDVAHVLGLSAAATSQQLKLLRDQGWLGMRNDGKMVYYRLLSEIIFEALQGDLAQLPGQLTATLGAAAGAAAVGKEPKRAQPA